MKRVIVLGASGSIGKQTIDILSNNRDEFQLVGFSVGSNVKYAKELLENFPEVKYIACLKDENTIKLKSIITSEQVLDFDQKGILDLIKNSKADIVVNAIVGFAGVIPTITAIENKLDVALANKESLVCAGHLIMPLVKEKGINLLPVDSEHSAIFQALNGERNNEIKRIILTASGGSFRSYKRSELKNVTVKEALKHPNWNMGSSITIDSATMYNKGLEIIEAKWLFDVDLKEIEVLIHQQSIIHSIVEFSDYSQIAQLGNPDMRVPIQYALTYPKRMPIKNSSQLSLEDIGNLSFEKADFKRYPALKHAYKVGELAGNAPTVLNAAKEVATTAFLEEKIPFLDIEKYVEMAIQNISYLQNPTIEQLVETDYETRRYVERNLE